MHLLAIDTTGANCSVALRRPDADDLIVSEAIGRGHAERLAPMAQSVLERADMPPEGLERVAVTTGPGSFAGTRVGVAFARGLGLATGARVLGIGNLAVFAAMTPDASPLVLVHDAKRGEAILALAQAGILGDAHRVSTEAIGAWIADQAGPDAKLAGPGIELAPPGLARASTERELDLRVLLDLGASLEPEAYPPSPFYARPPDAKLPGGISP